MKASNDKIINDHSTNVNGDLVDEIKGLSSVTWNYNTSVQGLGSHTNYHHDILIRY